MTIESPLHYEGTIEMIRRLNGLIEYSRAGMHPDDFATFEADMRMRIGALQKSVDAWMLSQTTSPLIELSNYTFCSSPANVMGIERGGPPPPRTRIEVVKLQRPAQPAGLSIWWADYV